MVEINALKHIAARRFYHRDQHAFAQFSGDYNLIHLDPILSRKTIAGDVIVHGMNLFLWAMESLVSKYNVSPTNISVKFHKPVFLEEIAICEYDELSKKVFIKQNDNICVFISLSFGKVRPHFSTRSHLPQKTRSRDLEINTLSVGDKFQFNLHGHSNSQNKHFTSLKHLYGSLFVEEIAGLSHIVGMECPGTYSLFASLELSLDFKHDNAEYEVSFIERRIKLIKMKILASCFKATVESFFRPKPVKNLSYIDTKTLVKKNEFKSVHALVIGGSRGLGECVAKLIAAGGGKTVISYFKGKKDAEHIREEICSNEGNCETIQIDMSGGEKITGLYDLEKFNQIYYFASPKISIENENDYKPKHKLYTQMYVSNFKKLVKTVSKANIRVVIFYPSTVYIDQPPIGFGKYVETKLAGEKLCEDLGKMYSKIEFILKRLPVLNTDQTQSLLGSSVDVKKNSSILLPIIREMRISSDNCAN